MVISLENRLGKLSPNEGEMYMPSFVIYVCAYVIRSRGPVPIVEPYLPPQLLCL